jgi:hypothetical protein
VKQFDATQHLEIFISFLDDKCLAQIGYFLKKPNLTFPELSKYMTLLYEDSSVSSDPLLELASRKQHNNETFLQYVHELERLAQAARIHADMFDMVIMERFRQGICDPAIQFEVNRLYISSPPKDIYDLIKSATEIQKFHDKLASENSSSGEKFDVCSSHYYGRRNVDHNNNTYQRSNPHRQNRFNGNYSQQKPYNKNHGLHQNHHRNQGNSRDSYYNAHGDGSNWPYDSRQLPPMQVSPVQSSTLSNQAVLNQQQQFQQPSVTSSLNPSVNVVSFSSAFQHLTAKVNDHVAIREWHENRALQINNISSKIDHLKQKKRNIFLASCGRFDNITRC